MPFVMCDQCQQPTGMGQTLTRTNPEDGETLTLCLTCDQPERPALTPDEAWAVTMRTLLHDQIVMHERWYGQNVPIGTLWDDALTMAAVTLGRSR